MPKHATHSILALLMAGALGLAGCAAAPAGSPTGTATDTPGSNQKEVSALTPRVVIAHEGGISMLDAETGAVIHRTNHEGFLRLSNAGDGRHVMVAAGDEFQVFDAGISASTHGDHSHYYEYTPGLTSVRYAAPKAGHVVPHAGYTTLFSDGTGEIQIIKSALIGTDSAPITKYRTDAAHHGVALQLENGNLFTTQGNQDGANAIQVKDGDKIIAEAKDCPGTHGETLAQETEKGEVVTVGCTTGPVVYRDGRFYKVKAADAYARSGNLFGSPVSPLVLADYKTDQNAKPERPTRVAIVDTRSAQQTLLNLGSAYWFRSFARGPQGQGLVLTYDGNVNVIDMQTRKVTTRIAAIKPWQEKTNWQEPGPIVKTAGNFAYVTDAENRQLVVIDLRSNTVKHRFQLDFAPVEMSVITGEAETPAH